MSQKRKRQDDSEEPKPEPDRKILIAIDLLVHRDEHVKTTELTFVSGTTFSGVAWAQTRKVRTR